jgi:hypothetical protein
MLQRDFTCDQPRGSQVLDTIRSVHLYTQKIRSHQESNLRPRFDRNVLFTLSQGETSACIYVGMCKNVSKIVYIIFNIVFNTYLMPICIFNILYAYLYIFNIYFICRYGVSILGPICIEQPCIYAWGY